MDERASCSAPAGFNNNEIRGDIMVRTRVAAVLAAASLCAAHLTAMAAPVHYNIQFSGGTVSGTLPTGSFDYDPATPAFSNFVVEWNGLNFNLTGGANSPIVFVSGQPDAPVCGVSGAARSFLLLTKDSCLPQELAPKQWELLPVGSDSLQFDFVGGGGQGNQMFFTSSSVTYASADECRPYCGSGSWQISRAIPEPGTLALVGFSLAGLAASRRRTR